VIVVLCLARIAQASPAADLVIYWAPSTAPPALADRAAAATRAAGAGFLDRRPAPRPPIEVAGLLQRGRSAYDALQFEDAVAVLDRAAAATVGDGAAGLTATELADVFLYRGLAWIQRGDDDRAWDDLVTAARLAPTRVLDPMRFPPRAIEAWTRAEAAIAGAPRARLIVATPGDCAITIDGALVGAASVEVTVGAHWVRVACRDQPAWGQRVEVSPAGATVEPPLVQAPTDDELLIQARATGARALVVVAVESGAITLRKLAIDGRELERRTVATAAADAAEATAAALTELLAAPSAPAARWYQSRWVWAAAGATAVAAVLVPVLAGRRDTAPTIVVRPAGLPPW